MDKLFDLMVMGAKYCLLCSTQLDDMIQVLALIPNSMCSAESDTNTSSPAQQVAAALAKVLPSCFQPCKLTPCLLLCRSPSGT
jgi:hypothetical protein